MVESGVRVRVRVRVRGCCLSVMVPRALIGSLTPHTRRTICSVFFFFCSTWCHAYRMLNGACNPIFAPIRPSGP